MQKMKLRHISSPSRSVFALFAALFMASVLMLSPTSVYAQTAPDPFACYGIADEYQGNGATDGLAIINRLDGSAQIIGSGTGTAGIEAMAFVPQDVNGSIQQVLFAVADPNNPDERSSNTLGTVDLTTGLWAAFAAPISTDLAPGAADGVWDIDGLTWDVQREILWATQRNSGDGNPDYLLQIDPANGALVPEFTPVPVPVADITGEGSAFQTDAGLAYDDIDDMAVDPVTGQIYAIMNKGGTGGGLVELNPSDGTVLNYIGLFTSDPGADNDPSSDTVIDDMEGLAFFNDGQLYGSTGANGPEENDKNEFYRINIADGTATWVGDFPADTRDIEALGCLTAPAFITLEKATNGEDADTPTGPTVTVGGPVTWTYVIENTGAVDLIDMTLNDDIEGDVSGRCEEGPLPNPFATGDTFTCTVVGTATTEGQYANVGTVDATYVAPGPGGDVNVPLSATDPSHYIGEAPPAAPGIQIVKTAGDAADGDVYTITAPGLVTFTYVVENTGETYLSDITITDDAGTSGDTADDVIVTSAECADLAGPVAPGTSVTCTAQIQVNGDATNVALTTGNPTDENGTDIPDATDPVDDDPADVDYVPPVAGISIVKTAGDATDGSVYSISEAGLVTFTYVVENTGGTYLTNIVINDDAGTLDNAVDDVTTDSTTCPELAGPLAPGATVTCTAQIQVNGDATNVADTTGTPTDENGSPLPEVDPPTDDDDAVVELLGSIGDTVWLDVNGDGVQDADESGIPGVTLILTLPDGTTTTATTGDDGLYLFPGLPAGDYVVTVETSTLPEAIAQTYDADGLGTPNESSLTLGVGENNLEQDFGYVPAGPGINIIKTAGDAADGDVFTIDAPGPVTYMYVVTNIGNTYLTDITISDDLGTADTSDDVLITSAECAELAGPLTPNEFVVCDTVIQVSGDVVNVATTTGTPSDENGEPLPNVEPPTDTDDAEVDYNPLGPGISIIKTAGDAADGEDYSITAPEQVEFTFLIENTGDTYLTNITITDDAGTPADAGDDVTLTSNECDGLAGPLAPNATVTCTLTLPVNTNVTNNAATTGTPTDENGTPLPDVDPPTDEDPANVLLQAGPAIQLQKTVYEGHTAGADCPGGELVEAAGGTPVTYCFEVQNTGTTYLNNIEVNDPDLGINRADMTLLSGTEPLASGQSMVFYFETTLDTGLLNTADTTGTPSDENGVPIPGVAPPTDDDTAEVIPLAAIGDIVWYDLNANGIQEPDETGIADVTVTLFDEAGNVLETMVTDENGNYGFVVEPGAYSVGFSVEDLDGFYLSPLDATVNDETDSDANPADGGRTVETSLVVGENDMSWDAGVYAPPILQIAKDDGDAVVQPNGTIIYSIVYSNTGVTDATGVVITERVPEFTTFSPELSTLGWECTQQPSTDQPVCTFEIGTVAKNSTGLLTLTFVVFVDRFIPENVQSINNIVTISDDGTRGVPPDGTFTDELITPIRRPTTLELSEEPGLSGNGMMYLYLPAVILQ